MKQWNGTVNQSHLYKTRPPLNKDQLFKFLLYILLYMVLLIVHYCNTISLAVQKNVCSLDITSIVLLCYYIFLIFEHKLCYTHLAMQYGHPNGQCCYPSLLQEQSSYMTLVCSTFQLQLYSCQILGQKRECLAKSSSPFHQCLYSYNLLSTIKCGHLYSVEQIGELDQWYGGMGW